MRDYSRFAQMLLHGGTLEGVRILGRKTVDLIAANHLTPNDFAGLKEERKKLKAEREKLTGQLRAENTDPEFIRRIIDCVNTVLNAEKEAARHPAERSETAGPGREKPQAARPDRGLPEER